jgi:hypothetical protein
MTYQDHRVTYYRGVKFTTYVIAHGWRAGRRAGWLDLPDGTMMPAAYITALPGLDWFDPWEGKPRIMTDALVQAAARDIADEIIRAARGSGDDPVVWVTGNRYMPVMRSFSQAEEVWTDPRDGDGEKFAWLCELVEQYVGEADVALECPDWDNAFYAVDLARWEYTETPDGESLQDDWTPRIMCAVCGEPLERVDVNAPDEYAHAGDEPADRHAPVMPEDNRAGTVFGDYLDERPLDEPSHTDTHDIARLETDGGGMYCAGY